MTVARRLFLAAICGLILVSARAFLDYGRLAGRLAGRTIVERGGLGIDEWRSFLARSGRLDLQRSYRDAERDGALDRQVSGLALAWSWVVQTEPQLPPGARIYLDLPNSVLYFFGTNVWYPRKLDVGSRPALIRDDASLQAAFAFVEPSHLHELRDRGYTHVVTVWNDRPVVVDLSDAADESRP